MCILREDKEIDCFYQVVFLFFIFILAFFFKVNEKVLLILILSFFSFISLFSPFNGMTFLLLVSPFLLGNSKRPNYFALELMVYVLCVFSLIRIFVSPELREKVKKYPYWGFIILFLASLILSLPDDIKDIYFGIKGALINGDKDALLNMWNNFLIAHEGRKEYCIRVFVNAVSALCLSISAFVFFNKDRLLKIIPYISYIYFVVMICSVLFYKDLLPHKGVFLTFSLVGKNGGFATGFAYNIGYLTQYLVVFMPLIALSILAYRNKIYFIYSIFAIISGIVVVGITGRRTAFLVLIVEVLFFLFLFKYKRRKNKASFFVKIFLFIFLMFSLATVYISDRFISSNRTYKRLYSTIKRKPNRLYNWRAGFEMFRTHPIIGIGIGKYCIEIPYYCKKANVPFEKVKRSQTTAHNIYLHLLSERGIVGFSVFVAFMIVLYLNSVYGLPALKDEVRKIALLLLTSLTGWLVYGFFQYMFYVRIMEIFFWFLVGIIGNILCAKVNGKLHYSNVLFLFALFFSLIFKICVVFIA